MEIVGLGDIHKSLHFARNGASLVELCRVGSSIVTREINPSKAYLVMRYILTTLHPGYCSDNVGFGHLQDTLHQFSVLNIVLLGYMIYEHSFLLEVALNGLRSVYYLTLKNSIWL